VFLIKGIDELKGASTLQLQALPPQIQGMLFENIL
jgi:hypothetical protein